LLVHFVNVNQRNKYLFYVPSAYTISFYLFKQGMCNVMQKKMKETTYSSSQEKA